jgi:hypothetical protein
VGCTWRQPANATIVLAYESYTFSNERPTLMNMGQPRMLGGDAEAAEVDTSASDTSVRATVLFPSFATFSSQIGPSYIEPSVDCLSFFDKRAAVRQRYIGAVPQQHMKPLFADSTGQMVSVLW